MNQKLYRFTFDKQSGLYKGLTYEQPWAENTTVIQPHFEAGFKTVFDFAFGAWKLVPQEIFYKRMSSADEIQNVVEYKNDVVKVLFNRLHEKLDSEFVLIDKQILFNFYQVKQSFIELNDENCRLKTFIGQNQDMLIELKDSVFVLSVLVERIALEQEKHYLYSRKSYWTSRLVDFVAQFYMSGRNIFFKFFNS